MRAYWKPCVVCRGSNTSPGLPSATTRSIMPTCMPFPNRSGERWSCVTSPDGSRASPCTMVSSVPRRPEVAQAQPAVDVLPEVDHLAIGTGSGDGNGSELLYPARRRCRGVGQGAQVVVGDRHGLPGLGPGPVVLELPCHEVGGQQRSLGGLPIAAGGDDDFVGVELPEKSKRAAEAVDGLEEADSAAPPAVGEDDLPDVVAPHEQRSDVVCLDVERGRVTGETWRQLHVADAPAVEERLVDPVRRGVEPGLRRWYTELERVAQQVGRALGLHGLDETSGPVRRVEQPGLEPGRRGPVALAAVGPDLYAPHDPLPRRQWIPRPGEQNTGIGFHPIGGAAVDLDGVRLLLGRARRQLPRQPRQPIAQSEDCRPEVLHRKAGRSVPGLGPPRIRTAGHLRPSYGFRTGQRANRNGVATTRWQPQESDSAPRPLDPPGRGRVALTDQAARMASEGTGPARI